MKKFFGVFFFLVFGFVLFFFMENVDVLGPVPGNSAGQIYLGSYLNSPM